MMNIANMLTTSRLFMCVFFVGMLSVPKDYAKWQPSLWEMGYVLAVLAGLTDFLDGYAARRWNIVTEFGRFLDPLCDKIFVVAGYVTLTDKQIVPGWVTVLILSREFAVQGLRQMCSQRGHVVAVSSMGKAKTVMQMLTLLLGGAMMVEWIPRQVWADSWLWTLSLWSTVFITAYTGASYFVAAAGAGFYSKEMFEQ